VRAAQLAAKAPRASGGGSQRSRMRCWCGERGARPEGFGRADTGGHGLSRTWTWAALAATPSPPPSPPPSESVNRRCWASPRSRHRAGTATRRPPGFPLRARWRACCPCRVFRSSRRRRQPTDGRSHASFPPLATRCCRGAGGSHRRDESGCPRRSRAPALSVQCRRSTPVAGCVRAHVAAAHDAGSGSAVRAWAVRGGSRRRASHPGPVQRAGHAPTSSGASSRAVPVRPQRLRSIGRDPSEPGRRRGDCGRGRGCCDYSRPRPGDFAGGDPWCKRSRRLQNRVAWMKARALHAVARAACLARASLRNTHIRPNGKREDQCGVCMQAS
jgi:hypothetical protein